MRQILAIDPGKDKCGIAVLSNNKIVLERKVISRKSLSVEIMGILSRFEIDTIILGGGTGSKDINKELRKFIQEVKIVLFPEKFTTLDARKRYWKENPPKGLWKLIPVTLRLPPKPYDDYVATLLGERFLESLH